MTIRRPVKQSPPRPARECRSCTYFSELPSKLAGECRRLPPRPIAIGILVPVVPHTFWCGEFTVGPARPAGHLVHELEE